MKLLVLANEFPYGQIEPYMETEEKYYSRFDKVWIGALQLRKRTAETKRKLQCNATVIPVRYEPRLFYLINSVTVLGDSSLYKEIGSLLKSKRLTLSRIVDLFVYLSRAHHEARVIDRALKGEDKSDILLYSYRFEYQPYVAVLLKKKWKTKQKIVSRAHGYDIYEEQHSNNYIPLRGYLLNNLDGVYPCSKYGVEYINEKYKKGKAVVEARYLGTVDYGIREYSEKTSKMYLVSCSNVNTVKRIDKIINALTVLNDIPFEWIHYGGGDLYDEIKSLAKDKLGEKAIFPGNISNRELLDNYLKKDFFLFINVSSSEGLPVSIMEALSIGIPCIATDVGGTKEIVNSSNGVLIPANTSDEEIADVIRYFYSLSREEYLQFRKNARQSWNDHFNAEFNYSAFINELIGEGKTLVRR